MCKYMCYRFIIFSLLIPFVHREGALGQQARDALLLCMVLSKNNQAVAEYIAHQSTVCPVSIGQSGQYLLPVDSRYLSQVMLKIDDYVYYKQTV